jgi:hypothetical protein
VRSWIKELKNFYAKINQAYTTKPTIYRIKLMIVQIPEPLQIIDSLYLKGYRSSLIDRALTKIIELERANTLKQASELQSKLQTYELQYQMGSEIFYQRFSEGSLGDEIDYFEWGVIYELWQSVQERLQVLQPKIV